MDKEYFRQRYHKWREDTIAKLGGECVVCGATENLEFDHIDPDEKTFPVSRLWSMSAELQETELKKCQLLCKRCHRLKTNWDKRMRGST